jgi:O-ureido-D-serine cyclo-ligase
LAGQDEAVEVAKIAEDERNLAERVLARWGEPLLYARVDVMRGEGGKALVGEVELIEPSLFLVHCPEALHGFAKAIAARARKGKGKLASTEP